VTAREHRTFGECEREAGAVVDLLWGVGWYQCRRQSHGPHLRGLSHWGIANRHECPARWSTPLNACLRDPQFATRHERQNGQDSGYRAGTRRQAPPALTATVECRRQCERRSLQAVGKRGAK
jgi:hypothetical protein